MRSACRTYTPEDLLAESAWLRRMARSLVREGASVDDLIQDTLVAGIRHPPAADLPARGWLATVMRNLVLGQARASRRHVTVALADELPAVAATPEELLERMQMQRIVADLVLDLDDPYRETILLHFVEGLSSAEISRRHGIPAGTVRWRLKWALDTLRARLDTRHEGQRRRWVGVLAPMAGMTSAGRPRPSLAPGSALVRTARILVPLAMAGAVVGWATLRRAPVGGSPDPAQARSVAAAGPGRPGRVIAISGPGTITGTVRGPDRAPIDGAIVTAFEQIPPSMVDLDAWNPRAYLRHAITSGGGRYRIVNLPTGLHALTATAAGFLAVEFSPVAVSETGTASRDLAFTSPGGNPFSGSVREVSAGPLVDAGVMALRYAAGGVRYAYRTNTDRDGRFQVLLPPSPSYSLMAEAQGYAAHRSQLPLDAPETRNLALFPSGSLSGQVRLAGTTEGGNGAEVWIDHFAQAKFVARLRTTADAGGRFTFTDLAPGEYSIFARRGPLVGERSGNVSVAPAAALSDLAVEITTGASIAGRVTSTAGGVVGGARVVVSQRHEGTSHTSQTGATVTDAAGGFVILGLRPGGLDLMVRKDGFAFHHAEVTIETAVATSLEIALVPSPTVSGLVHGPDGAPVAAARIHGDVHAPGVRMGASERAMAGPDGRFRLVHLAAGTLQIGGWTGTLAGTAGPMALTAAGDATVNIRLEPGARVSGRVRFDDGTPASGVRVIGSWRSALHITLDPVRSGHDGSYDLGPFVAGPAMVRAVEAADTTHYASHHGAEQADLQLAAGEQRQGVDLVVPRRVASITGVLVDHDDKPVSEAIVQANLEVGGRARPRSREQQDAAVTDGTGVFTIGKLARGPHTVRVRHPRYPEIVRNAVAAPLLDLRLQFERPATLTGTVVGPGRRPARDFAVRLVPSAPAGETARDRDRREGLFERPKQSVHDTRGQFTFWGLAAGRWDVRVTSPEGLVASAGGVEVVPGRESKVSLTLARGLVVRGHVAEYGTGRPLAGVLVRAQLPENGPETRTGSDGTFTLWGMHLGRVTGLFFEAAGQNHLTDGMSLSPDPGVTAIDAGTLLLVAGKLRAPDTGTLGISWIRTERGLMVREVTPGSPAAQGGLGPGDRLLAVDGVACDGLGVNGASTRLRGPAGTSVVLQLASAGAPREAKLTRAPRPEPAPPK